MRANSVADEATSRIGYVTQRGAEELKSEAGL